MVVFEEKIEIPINCIGEVVGNASKTIKSFMNINGLQSALVVGKFLRLKGDSTSIEEAKIKVHDINTSP